MSNTHAAPRKHRGARRLATLVAVAGLLLVVVLITGVPGSGPAKAGDDTGTTIERPDNQKGANGEPRPN